MSRRPKQSWATNELALLLLGKNMLAEAEIYARNAVRLALQNQRYARTASYAQVTERLYDRSRYRYRSYLKQLAPVVETLRPVIERLGYVV